MTNSTYPLYWRAEEASEEETVNPLAAMADKADARLKEAMRQRLDRLDAELRRQANEGFKTRLG